MALHSLLTFGGDSAPRHCSVVATGVRWLVPNSRHVCFMPARAPLSDIYSTRTALRTPPVVGRFILELFNESHLFYVHKK